ncbi:MAG: hypothetical protein ACK463_43825, partial [Bradyrhizobium sp.]
IPFMAKIIRSQRAGTSSVRSAPKKKVAKAAKPLSKGTAKKAAFFAGAFFAVPLDSGFAAFATFFFGADRTLEVPAR